MFYIIVALKLVLGLLALVLVINLTGKGNLAPASATDQVQNYVLGGIVGGVKIDVATARKIGLSANNLAFKLRMQGIYTVKDVKQAILEQDGQLIVTSFGEENPKYPLVTDGIVQHTTLEMIDKDEDWLLAELKAQGIEEVDAVFLAEYDDGKISITKYEG